MSPAGLQGAVRSHQVQLLMPGTDVGSSLSQISPTRKRNHILKLLGEFLGELVKVNTAKWQEFPFKYKVFDKHNSSTRK